MITGEKERKAFLLNFNGIDNDKLSILFHSVQKAYSDMTSARKTFKDIGNIFKNEHGSRDTEIQYKFFLKATYIIFDNILNKEFINQSTFDEAHKDCCSFIIKLFVENNYQAMQIGGAQKWVNMALKYYYIYCSENLSDKDNVNKSIVNFFHCPIDNIIIYWIVKKCKDYDIGEFNKKKNPYLNEKIFYPDFNAKKILYTKVPKFGIKFNNEKITWSKINDWSPYYYLQGLISNILKEERKKPEYKDKKDEQISYLDFDMLFWGQKV